MKLLHWKMVEVLAQEVAERRWAYAEQAPYPSVNSGYAYLYILIDIFATEDPRFWAIGLKRCQEKGTFSYTLDGVTYYGVVAARVFLGSYPPGTINCSSAFSAMLYKDRDDGLQWLQTLVKKMGGDELDVSGLMQPVPYPIQELQDEVRE